jgi:membrane-bound lytic murein transglycosylase A
LFASVIAGRAVTAVLVTALAAAVSAGVAANPHVKRAENGVKAKAKAAKEARPKVLKATYRPVAFGDLPGWGEDDHLAAFQVFSKSCERVILNGRERPPGADKATQPQVPPPALVAICGEAVRQAKQIKSKDSARAFFERSFTPSAVVNKRRPGMLTGYYEPLLEGARKPDSRFKTPIYKRPPDLVNVVDDTKRGTLKPGAVTHVRKTEKGTEPYYTRAEIDQGALQGKGLELLYLTDAVDVFFMQIQGSARIRLTDGSTVRIHYDGKNGHPYSSIGRYLIDKALLAADRVSMGALAEWLRADPERAKTVMWHNASYVFFRELKGGDDLGAPLGAMQVALTAGRSLAFDPSYHALGSPVYVSVPTLKPDKGAPFNRLMVGQDVGSAIRGPERGDIYYGSGDAAGKLAGTTKHPGRFFVLVPKPPPAATEAAVAPDKAAVQKTGK